MLKLELLDANQKTAILLLALGESIAGEILKHLPKDQILTVTTAMNNLGRVDHNLSEQIIADFHKTLVAENSTLTGSPEQTKSLLQQALGTNANDIVKKITLTRPKFPELETMAPAAIAVILEKELPQVIALVLTSLPSKLFGETLKCFSVERQLQVIERIARMEQVSQDTIEDAQVSIAQAAKHSQQIAGAKLGGTRKVAALLAQLDASTRERLLGGLEEHDSDLAEEVTANLFIFSDIAGLTDPEIRILLQKVSSDQWRLALRGVTQDLLNRITSNLSKRAAEILIDDMESAPKVRRSEVEEAQRSICLIVTELTKEGLIGNSDEFV